MRPPCTRATRSWRRRRRRSTASMPAGRSWRARPARDDARPQDGSAIGGRLRVHEHAEPEGRSPAVPGHFDFPVPLDVIAHPVRERARRPPIELKPGLSRARNVLGVPALLAQPDGAADALTVLAPPRVPHLVDAVDAPHPDLDRLEA